MPAITRWYIKTSFGYFLFALVIGIFLAIQSMQLAAFPAADLYPTYIHIFTEGWLTMLIIGVALWMFPKLTLEQPRGNPILGWSSYILLNAGLLLRIVSEPFVGISGLQKSPAIILTLAAVLQWLGGMVFVYLAWGRVKVK